MQLQQQNGTIKDMSSRLRVQVNTLCDRPELSLCNRSDIFLSETPGENDDSLIHRMNLLEPFCYYFRVGCDFHEISQILMNLGLMKFCSERNFTNVDEISPIFFPFLPFVLSFCLVRLSDEFVPVTNRAEYRFPPNRIHAKYGLCRH